MLFYDFTCSGSEFQRVGTRTEKNTSSSMCCNSRNKQVKTRRTELWFWVLEKASKIDMKVLQNNCLMGNGVQSEEISGVGLNGKTE